MKPGMQAQAIMSMLDGIAGVTWRHEMRSYFTGGVGELIDFRYECPCGEISGIGTMIPKYMTRQHALAIGRKMRAELWRHVKDEGNEPSFDKEWVAK